MLFPPRVTSRNSEPSSLNFPVLRHPVNSKPQSNTISSACFIYFVSVKFTSICVTISTGLPLSNVG